MTLLGFDLEPWSLAGALGSAGLGLAGGWLSGWRGPALSFLAGAALAVFVMSRLAAWQAAGEAAARERWQREGLELLLAASEAAHAVEIADRKRALLAAESAAAAERRLALDLEQQLEELRRAPPDDDRTLSPTAQRFFDGLRQP